MAFKRALVVDDSRSARISLKRLLEDQQLEVFLADSGEAAIDLLHAQMVDVIFMDHNMPGMDGLEALTAIKSDPRTATVPVMMYTTMEGEVYVSQARALGAVGVLPKTFQPHVLFDMLLELGLVTDRRANPNATPAETPAEAQRRNQIQDRSESEDPERAVEQQALGISVQTLVQRILEDQHLSLRADILQSHRDFAHQVANEVLAAQPAQDLPVSNTDAETISHPATKTSGVTALITVVLGAALIVLASLYWQMRESQTQLTDALRNSNAQLELLESTLQLALTSAQQPPAETSRDSDLATLTWAANLNNRIAFAEPAFGAAAVARLEGLMAQLRSSQFRGQVVVESHLGEFCLISNDSGGWDLAPDDLPLLGCSLVGHPLDASRFVEARQDESFAAFLSDLAANAGSEVQVLLIAHDRLSSQVLRDYPQNAQQAGEWNEAARENHRLEIRLIPAD